MSAHLPDGNAQEKAQQQIADLQRDMGLRHDAAVIEIDPSKFTDAQKQVAQLGASHAREKLITIIGGDKATAVEQMQQELARLGQSSVPQGVIARAPRSVPMQVPRNQVKRITNVRELREAAANCAQGIPVVGSTAWQKIKDAEEAGDFKEAASLRAQVIGFAPALYAEADRVEALQKAQHEARVTDAMSNLGAITRAEEKRKRKAAKRLREQG